MGEGARTLRTLAHEVGEGRVRAFSSAPVVHQRWADHPLPPPCAGGGKIWGNEFPSPLLQNPGCLKGESLQFPTPPAPRAKRCSPGRNEGQGWAAPRKHSTRHTRTSEARCPHPPTRHGRPPRPRRSRLRAPAGRDALPAPLPAQPSRPRLLPRMVHRRLAHLDVWRDRPADAAERLRASA